jgi:glycosyltransferase involved in cell wall biosynthesis
MRVLHVNKFLYRRGGAEAYMEDLAELQRAAGHDIEFFGMEHPQNDVMTYRSSFPSEVPFDPPPSGLLGKARAVGRMLHSTSAARGIDEVLGDFRPDVVHFHNIYHQLSPSILQPVRARGIPSVMTLHDYKLVCSTYQLLAGEELCERCIGGSLASPLRTRCNRGSLIASAVSAFETYAHRRTGAYDAVGRFIAPSRFLAAKVVAGGIDPARVATIPHFIALDGVPEPVAGGTGVAFAGRLSHEKGVDTLIEAVAQLPDDVTLTVAGDGPDRMALEAQALRRLPGRVKFLGRLPRADVLALLRSAAVVDVPSRWHENQPMIVLEALACGTPVVASDLGGLPELIASPIDGALCPANDPGALARALAGVLAEVGHPSAPAQRRRRVELEFSQAAHLERIHAAYELAGSSLEGSR